MGIPTSLSVIALTSLQCNATCGCQTIGFTPCFKTGIRFTQVLNITTVWEGGTGGYEKGNKSSADFLLLSIRGDDSSTTRSIKQLHATPQKVLTRSPVPLRRINFTRLPRSATKNLERTTKATQTDRSHTTRAATSLRQIWHPTTHNER